MEVDEDSSTPAPSKKSKSGGEIFSTFSDGGETRLDDSLIGESPASSSGMSLPDDDIEMGAAGAAEQQRPSTAAASSAASKTVLPLLRGAAAVVHSVASVTADPLQHHSWPALEEGTKRDLRDLKTVLLADKHPMGSPQVRVYILERGGK